MDEMANSEAGEPVQIEEIMESIHRQLGKGEQNEPAGNVFDGPLPNAFYEHLNQARLIHDRIEPRAQLAPSDAPLIGPLLNIVRQKLHELILFYVNQMAANQIRFNAHMLQAVTILSQELEKDDRDHG